MINGVTYHCDYSHCHNEAVRFYHINSHLSWDLKSDCRKNGTWLLIHYYGFCGNHSSINEKTEVSSVTIEEMIQMNLIDGIINS